MMNITQDFAPPFKLIAPYFIIGVIFYLISSILTLSINPSELSIHSPDLLSWTHMFLLGFVMMIIFGAMQQMMPVLAGSVVPKPKIFALIVHTSLTLGAFFLSFSFIFDIAFFLHIGVLFLSTKFSLIPESGDLSRLGVGVYAFFEMVLKSFLYMGFCCFGFCKSCG